MHAKQKNCDSMECNSHLAWVVSATSDSVRCIRALHNYLDLEDHYEKIRADTSVRKKCSPAPFLAISVPASGFR